MKRIPSFVAIFIVAITLLLSPVAFAQTQKGVVTAVVNIRKGPGTDYPLAGATKKNQTVTILAISDDGMWYQIGEEQWVFAQLVRLLDSESNDTKSATSKGRTARPTKTFKGSGIATIDLSTFSQPAILQFSVDGKRTGIATITGNSKLSKSLPIAQLSASSLSLPFYYSTIINYYPAGEIITLDIFAPGEWKVELWPLNTAPTLSSSKAITGIDDEVIKLDALTPIWITIENDDPGENGIFAMETFGDNHQDMVSTEFASQQRIQIDKPVDYIKVTGNGHLWKIAIEDEK